MRQRGLSDFFARQSAGYMINIIDMTYRRTHRGFTLIELIVVMAILGVLIGIAAPALIGYLNSGDVVKCRANLEEISKLGLKYGEDMGHRNLLPTSGMDDDEDTPEMNESEGWWYALALEMDSTVLPSKNKKMKLSTIFHCPGDQRKSVPASGLMEGDLQTVSYVSWTDGSEDKSNPNSQIRTTGKKHLDNLPWLSDGIPQKGKSVIDLETFTKMVMPTIERHSDTVVVAYASGQVRAFKVNDPENANAKELFQRINPDKLIPLRNKRK